MNTNTKTVKGFTLIELLVVIGILAVLSVVIILTLNPAELLKQARDSTRISDLSTVRTAISLYQVDAVGAVSVGDSVNCYVSMVGTGVAAPTGLDAANCALAGTFAGLPRFAGTPTAAVTIGPAAPNSTGGSGWVRVNIGGISTGSGGPPISNLPLDPTNSTALASGTINTATAIASYYAYRAGTPTLSACADGVCSVFEINAFLESAKFQGQMINDGGNEPRLYEVGTAPGLTL